MVQGISKVCVILWLHIVDPEWALTSSGGMYELLAKMSISFSAWSTLVVVVLHLKGRGLSDAR